MPAIEFSRLRTKIELLGRVYAQPEQFVKDLSDLYFFYSDLTFQSDSSYAKASLYSSYRAPLVINRELEHAFRSKATHQSEETLKIIDQLWATRIIEPSQFAIALLGSLPVDYSDAVVERIEKWSQSGENPDLITLLFGKGTNSIRKDQPELWLSTLSKWYNSQDQTKQKLALMGLIPIIDDPDLSNLPMAYGFLLPILCTPDAHLVFTLLTIIEKMAAKSESETVYFLKQIIEQSKSPDLPRLIRRALPSFSEPAQLSLKTCLRQYQGKF